ncbi:hypothetical protein IE4872_CH01469 [Rhizobium gallicum]|uniref:Uncharacterized protein n=1 Tax=Rhizobium gallicum TaxID=56730 RepID=A0A1L5NGS4_9HYPH|nr:hypothetical protein IE4872_CH01469 [Rhizobium gallicum]
MYRASSRTSHEGESTTASFASRPSMADDIDNMRADFRLGNWNKCLGVAGWVSGAPALVPAP